MPALPFSRVERSITRFDGGSELEALQEEAERGMELTESQQTALDENDFEAWRRPCLAVRDQAGDELPCNAAAVTRPSVYTKRLNEFAVCGCPKYRRLGTVRAFGNSEDKPANDSNDVEVFGFPADTWMEKFGADVRRLATEILIHICGESCYKYSSAKLTQICRHGFYYVVVVGDWQRRRRGKPLRNAVCIIQETEFGMQGRLRLFQEHPFECQSNYGALAALRCHFDIQDLRRLLPAAEWLEEELPHLGECPDLGYMNSFEWNGKEWQLRRPDLDDIGDAPVQWTGTESPEDWREILLDCLRADSADAFTPEQKERHKRLDGEVIASFSDGLNTGFYINAYTTKHCPTMDGVLEEMRRGLDRLHQTREETRARLDQERIAQAASDANGFTRSSDSRLDQGLSFRRRSPFGDTLEVLKRLSASYRRCYWKSGSEMLFPIFYGHMNSYIELLRQNVYKIVPYRIP